MKSRVKPKKWFLYYNKVVTTMTYGVYELKDELTGYAALVDQLMENKAPLRDIITTVERGNRV
jgi:hypothetical protein